MTLRKTILVFLASMLLLLRIFDIKPCVTRIDAEPFEIYFFEESARNVWDLEKNYSKMLEMASYGNFSVVILCHIYRTGGSPFYAEWWVAATTLQPDECGLIHELVLRTTYPYPSIRKTYTSALNYNHVSPQQGANIIQEFINQDPDQYRVGFTNDSLHTEGPFLIYQCFPIDVGMTIILNLNTANLMIAATGVWMGSGSLILPEKDGTLLDIKDIFIVAKKFGTKVGDPSWDPEADLNNDGIVNIIDLFLIARCF